jgi:hypothetical protein
MIRNNTMVGAAAGNPGTAPTNWLWPTAGGNLTKVEIIGVGIESGIEYIDVQLVASGAIVPVITFDQLTQIVAANGQTWANSIYLKLAGGSLTNVDLQNRVVYRDAGGTALTSQNAAVVPTSSALRTQRNTNAFAASDASTARITGALFITFAGAGDITLRIGLPQLQLGSDATPAISTSGSAVYLPRSNAYQDYNPSTLAPLGFLIEEQRTNSIRNNTMVGAVSGTPGTLPTNWFTFTALTGLTLTLSVGTENGINYLGVRLSGTPSGAGTYFVGFDQSNGCAASTGQTFTNSIYLNMPSGSMTGITDLKLGIDEYNSGPTLVKTNLGSALTAPTASGLATQRQSYSVALGGVATASALPYLRYNLSGAAIDITLRIGLPQLELGAFATSVIKTTTTAATRLADSATITGTNFSSWYNQTEGTFVAEKALGLVANGGNQFTVRASDNTFNNSNGILSSSTGYMTISTASGGVFDGLATVAQLQVSKVFNKTAGAYKANDLAISYNGNAVVTDGSATIPTSLTRLDIGKDHIGANDSEQMWLKSFSYYRTRLPNATLVSLST